MIAKIPIHCREDLAQAYLLEQFLPQATCTVCNTKSNFAIDFNTEDLFMAYRESARCTSCNLVGRQRAVMTRVKQYAQPGDVIYLQEQVTSSYQWAVHNLTDCTIIGSEYMPCDPWPNIRHEDVQALSFANQSVDIIISQDVFEHVADPWCGFVECFRVLKPGGRMFMTIPFAGEPTEHTVDRIKAGLPDFYHGNPLSEQGSIVYSDFGWDIVQRVRNIGFDVDLGVYRSNLFGWASPILLFELIKPTSSSPAFPV